MKFASPETTKHKPHPGNILDNKNSRRFSSAAIIIVETPTLRYQNYPPNMP